MSTFAGLDLAAILPAAEATLKRVSERDQEVKKEKDLEEINLVSVCVGQSVCPFLCAG